MSRDGLQATWDQVDAYIGDTLLRNDKSLEQALKASDDAGIPPINVAPNQGKLLELIARLQGAKRILEIGTLAGYSTIWLARALPREGKLVTLESDTDYAKVATTNIANAGFADLVDIRVGKAADTLAELEVEGVEPFDLVFIDADKPSNPTYFLLSLELSRPGTVIIADNVIRDGAVTDQSSQDPKVQGIRRFNELVAAEPRVEATAIQTVGSKGYDGFAMVLVTH